MVQPPARGKYTSSDLRQIIAADKGDDPRWPLRVAEKQKRSYGALVTFLSKIENRGLTFAEIEQAMDDGVTPELATGLEQFLANVAKHGARVNTPTDETGSFAFVDSALAGVLERVELKIDRIEAKVDDLLERITKIISSEETAPAWVDLDHVHVSSAEEYAKGDLHGVLHSVPIIAEEE